MSQISYSRYKYNPNEINEKDFLEKFVVRTDIFEEIFEDIKNSDYSIQNNHYIIIGQRGQGKTTLLRRVELEVQTDKELSKFLLPIRFAEEQYQIRSLFRLWEEIAEYLDAMYEEFSETYSKLEAHFDDEDYELKSFSYLEKVLKEKKKKLILFIDNIDELFGKLKTKEQRHLREIMLESTSFRIVGGSTKMFEQHYDYSKPFYEFFHIIKLKGLQKEEAQTFLKSVGNDEQRALIEKIIKKNPERIETLRRLTGGVPRTLIMLFDIFVDDKGEAFEDLIEILDEVTPLYKDRMDDLPPTLQDIVHAIAMNWDGMLTKEIASKTRMESKEVSAQLKQLEKYQIIDFEFAGKNKIYKLQERFFNIWYLMRFGRKKDRQRVEWLVKFLSSWCTPEELKERAENFIKSLKTSKIHESYAYHMGEALRYSGLDLETEHKLKESVYSYLTAQNSQLAKDLSHSDQEIMEDFIELYKSGQLHKSIKKLLKIKDKNKDILAMLGELYSNSKEYDKAEEFYLKAIESGNNKALNNLGILYFDLKEYDKAEEFYLKAIESGKNYAFNNLGILYKDLKKHDKAEEFYLKAIKSGDNDALYNLGNLYLDLKEYDKAEEFYLKAIDSGDKNALNNLGNLYYNLKEYDKAEEFYLKAIESGDNDALNNLGILYADLKKYDKAEEFYLKAIESGNDDALYNLGNLYADLKKYDKAEEFFLKAIESGDNGVLNSLAWFYFELNRKREESQKLINRSCEKEENYFNVHTLATILLWNEEFSQSYEKLFQWLEYENALEAEEDISIYFILLMAKGQLYKAKEFFEMEEYSLKERYKPLWYALMKLMEKDFPHEYKKMGGELEESVGEILEEVEEFREKYKV